MSDDATIRQILETMLDTGASPEQLCVDRPDLLPLVIRRSRLLRAVDHELNQLFPTTRPFHSHPPTQLSATPDFLGYDNVSFLGRGGMGVVYKAHHIALHRTVAIKMLLPSTIPGPDERATLQREAAAVAALQHPNIVQVFEIGENQGRPYFSMEYLQGGTLAERVRGQPQSPAFAAELVATLSRAIHAAHQSGIVHRDLKPGNILFASDGSPKIADFSLARSIVPDSNVSQSGAILGTPSYMAPEQALSLTGWCLPPVDIYALGAILYDLLAGRPPFRADTPIETHRQVIEEEPAALTRLNARVPRDLETICLKCLQKDPARRYPSALALAEDLTRFLQGEPIVARPSGNLERVAKWVRRRPAQATAIGVAAVCLSLFAGIALWSSARYLTMQQAIREDLTQATAFLQAGDWIASRSVLSKAQVRLDSAGGSNSVRIQAKDVQRELDLIDRLTRIRFQRANAQDKRFSRAATWQSYRSAFLEAGLLKNGDRPEEFATRISNAIAKAALVNAMDDWALCATDRSELAWLLTATTRADPDPLWRDHARNFNVWTDRNRLEELAKSAQVEREPVPLLLIIAGLLFEKGSAEAMPFLQRAHAAHPSDFWMTFAVGEQLDSQRDPDAIGYYRAAVSLRPDAVAAHINLGIALAVQNRYDEAIDCGLRALHIEPDSPLGHFNVAIWQIQQSKYALAVQHARQVVRLDPKNPDAHGILGRSLFELEDFQSAATAFRDALALLPESDPRRDQLHSALIRCEESINRSQEPSTKKY